jgi:hypothetical protein
MMPPRAAFCLITRPLFAGQTRSLVRSRSPSVLSPRHRLTLNNCYCILITLNTPTDCIALHALISINN